MLKYVFSILFDLSTTTTVTTCHGSTIQNALVSRPFRERTVSTITEYCISNLIPDSARKLAERR